DQDCGANSPVRNTKFFLRQLKDVVPNARLEVALHLGQIEIGTASTRDQFLCVVVKKQSTVENATGDWFAIDQHMLRRHMPAARPGHKHGDLLIKLVLFSFGMGEMNCAANS